MPWQSSVLHVCGNAQILATFRQTQLSRWLLAEANKTSRATFIATSDVQVALQAALQSLKNGQRRIRDKQQSRTAKALAKVAAKPSLLQFSVWKKRYGV